LAEKVYVTHIYGMARAQRGGSVGKRERREERGERERERKTERESEREREREKEEKRKREREREREREKGRCLPDCDSNGRRLFGRAYQNIFVLSTHYDREF
jgi:hypothetical protein